MRWRESHCSGSIALLWGLDDSAYEVSFPMIPPSRHQFPPFPRCGHPGLFTGSTLTQIDFDPLSSVALSISGSVSGDLPADTGNTQPAAGGAPLDIRHSINLCSDPPTAGGFDSHFNGRLLELAIWNRALSASAIRSLYYEVRAPPPPPRARGSVLSKTHTSLN